MRPATAPSRPPDAAGPPPATPAPRSRPQAPPRRNGGRRRPPLPLLLGLFLLAVYLTTGGGKGYSVDGAFGYEMARSVSLDPEHGYFKRFRSAFARWGALMPLLGQPFVLAGDALARVAPQRDALDAGGHRFRVEEWPPLGAGERPVLTPPLPQTGGRAVRSVALVSFLADGLTVPQGAVAGEVRLRGSGREVVLPVRAGVETAEWALDRPDVAGRAGHRRPAPAGHWIGQPRGNLYYARLDLPEPMVLDGWEVLPGPGLGAARWHLRGAAFLLDGTDDRWADVLTGERFWSERETGDFFTRFVYATLNAFTTTGMALLVYALSRCFGFGRSVAALATLGFGLGTMAWPYARLDFSEPASTLFVLVALWAFYRAFPPRGAGSDRPAGDRPRLRPWQLGLVASGALLVAVAGKYTAALFGAALLVQWALSSGWWRPAARRDALTFLAALVLPVAVLGTGAVAAAYALTGEVPIVLSPSQVSGRLAEDWLALPLWTGLRGLLFSPGKSLFLYAPWLLLALPGAFLLLRRAGRDAVLLTLFPAAVVVLYGMKLGWHGGSWGPRYLLPIVPLLAVAATPAVAWLLERGRGGRLALVALATVSVGVQALGLAKDPERYPAMVREFVVPALPDEGSRLGGRDYWLARGGPGLDRALQDADPAGGHRGLGYLWGYPDASLLVEVRQPRRFALSLYFVDWDRQGRRQTVTVEDAGGTRVWDLDRDFGDGLWASWEVEATPERPLRVSLAQRGPDTAVVSAAAFDAPGRGGTDRPRLDEGTRGDWRGVFGANGYLLFAWRSFNVDVSALPAYAARYELDHVGDKPDPRIHVEVAEADVLDTALLYAAPFSPLLGNLWLLLADLVHLLIPARPDLLLGVLSRPPWAWFGVPAPLPPNPEYGLGLDFWPTLLYVNYASHPGLLGAMWVALVTLQAVLIGAGAGLAYRIGPPAGAGRRALLAAAGLGLLCLVYSWLQVQA